MATAAESTTDLTISALGKDQQPNGISKNSSTSRGTIFITAPESPRNCLFVGSSTTPHRLIRDNRTSTMGANPVATSKMPQPHPLSQNHSSPPFILSNHSSGSIMAENIGALREVDAEMLELGVEEKRIEELADFDDEGRRLEASASVASFTDLDTAKDVTSKSSLESLEAWAQGNIMQAEPSTFASEHISESPAHHVDSSRPTFTHSSSTLQNDTTTSDSMPEIDEDSTIHIPHPPSDSSEPTLIQGTDEPFENDDFYIGDSHCRSDNRSATSSSGEIDEEALARRRAAGRHARSDSFDRRKNESALFAEAVGESSLLLKKIIEEDSSSDFDDDDIDIEEGNQLQGEDVVQHDFELSPEGLISEETQGHAVNAIDRFIATTPNDATAVNKNQSFKVGKVETALTSIDPPQTTLNDESFVFEEHDSIMMCQNEVLPHNSSFNFPSRGTTPAASPCSRKQDAIARPYIRPLLSLPNTNWKFIRHFSSGANLDSNTRSSSGNFNGIAASSDESFVYRGIRANPPEITQRGVSRGNYAQLHRKAWLEVTDKHHRYGKNLRMYYKHWESLGHPYHMFFDWLDSKGEAEGKPLPEIPELPRSVLDTDTVLYITNPDVSARYALEIVVDPADGSAIVLDQKQQTPIHTGKEGWIFILRDHVFYGSQKVTAPNAAQSSSDDSVPCKFRQRFHHSSFFGGKAVASAGIFLTDDQGRMTHLYPHSGHYRPGEAHMQRVLFFLQRLGVELSTFDVDMQQIFKVSRKSAPNGDDSGEKKEKKCKLSTEKRRDQSLQCQQAKKSKKTDCLHLMGGLEVACFLGHKALMIQFGVFHQIHKIRRLPHESRNSVIAVLDFINADDKKQ
ncbi:hypothetical protein ACHAXS_013584 [Conticribra weissflogii]